MKRQADRSKLSVNGAKALLSALAVTGTIGGWARLTQLNPVEDPITPSPAPPVLVFDPLPTLIPEPTAIDAPLITPQPAPTQMALRRVDNPVSSPSSGGGGGGGGAATTRSS